MIEEGGAGWQMIIATRAGVGGGAAPPIVTEENLALMFEMQAKVSDVATCGWLGGRCTDSRFQRWVSGRCGFWVLGSGFRVLGLGLGDSG